MGWSAEAQVQAISSWSKLVASIWSKGAYLVLAAVAPYERHSLVESASNGEANSARVRSRVMAYLLVDAI